MTQRVFVDANVLFSKTLMDWLYFLRQENVGMFHLYATEDVFAEVLANIRKSWPSAPGNKTAKRAKLMRLIMDEVLQDFSAKLRFDGLDPHDYHVHAGAIAARADIILTCNRPRDITTSPHSQPYEIMHPDAFFMLVTDSNPVCLIPIIQAQTAYWSRREFPRQLDEALVRAECPRFAQRVKDVLVQNTSRPS